MFRVTGDSKLPLSISVRVNVGWAKKSGQNINGVSSRRNIENVISLRQNTEPQITVYKLLRRWLSSIKSFSVFKLFVL